jgi:hypothetical protein
MSKWVCWVCVWIWEFGLKERDIGWFIMASKAMSLSKVITFDHNPLFGYKEKRCKFCALQSKIRNSGRLTKLIKGNQRGPTWEIRGNSRVCSVLAIKWSKSCREETIIKYVMPLLKDEG